MNKIKTFFNSEKKVSIAIFSFLVMAAFGLIFGPTVFASFSLQNGGTGYGSGYGYGYGFGVTDGSYRIDGETSLDQYGYGYGFAAYAWFVGDGSCSRDCGSGTQTQTVVCKDNSGAAVNDTFCTATKPTATSQACNTQACSSGSNGGGGGGSYNAQECTSVTYGDYTAACFGNFNFRPVLTRTPANCALTVAQQTGSQRDCITGLPIVTINGNQPLPTIGDTNSAKFIALEKSLVKKINKALAKRLSGRILLQVQEKGQAWYVYPVDQLKYFMGTPSDAFALMRKMALGINNKDFASFKNGKAPARLAGLILLKVQDHGMAYYVNPVDLKMYYLGRPADAFSIMRKLGLGITNADLRQIGVGVLK